MGLGRFSRFLELGLELGSVLAFLFLTDERVLFNSLFVGYFENSVNFIIFISKFILLPSRIRFPHNHGQVHIEKQRDPLSD